MAVDFRERFDVLPIPVDPRRAVWQAGLIQGKVEDAGGFEPGVAAAVQAILEQGPNDPPSELGRLRELYGAAYSPPELRSLVVNTFADLGIVPEGDGD